jgi:hypothetical protein
MKAVDQIIVDKNNGDCTRACLASILEVDINYFPNFITLGRDWFRVFWKSLSDHKCEYHGTGWVKSLERPHGNDLIESPNIDGFVIASVASRTFKDVGHSVVMNLLGEIVHDPNPNKLWQNENVLISGELQHWMMISKSLTLHV